MTAGALEESTAFSKLTKKLIVPFGIDQGGDLISLLVRISGNAAEHCSALAVVERGMETLQNLQDAIFSDRRIAKKSLSLLALNKCLALTFKVADGSEIAGCACVSMQPKGALPDEIRFFHGRRDNT